MSSEVGAAIAFGILAAIFLSIAMRRGFFRLRQEGQKQNEWIVPIRFVHLIGAFVIYFLFSSGLTLVFVQLFKQQIMRHFHAYSSWLNFSVSFLIFIALAIYVVKLPYRVGRGMIRQEGTPRELREDAWGAFTSWILAYPLVLFLSQMLEWIIYKVFQVSHVPDQMAVKFLKTTFQDPLYFTLAVISIVILAPLIEETLFRGFFQTYVRQHLGSKQAIFITSICFSLFHYSAGQGLGNISIIIPLFILSLFLGLLYEKRRSLFASITLHATFNLISVINLYLFGGFTTGL